MKNIIRNTGISFLLALLLPGCEAQNEIETITILKPFEKTPEYYENLRAYKGSDHQLAFGWFGNWTAKGATMASRLATAPDSMDIISIWGQWNELTPEQYADKEFVQKVKGTKVIFTTFAHTVPEIFGNTEEGIKKYAYALADSVAKYGYDGLDLDYEPNYGGSGPLCQKNNMEIFVRALSENLGPKSGSGRLLCIDGEPYYLNEGLAELFDYGIVQSYSSSGDSDLQGRFNRAYAIGWKPEQYIFTENFESLWRTGGTTNFTDSKGNRMPSLIGMARFQPTQGQKAGVGTYHMEYEYAHEPDYKFMRMAIQTMNPAVE
ncbi:MAG: glycoside hydrolase family 18 [Bacteroidales bacterium]